MNFYMVVDAGHRLLSQHSVLRLAQIECDMRTHDSRPPKLYHVTDDEGNILYTAQTCYTLAKLEAEREQEREEFIKRYPLDVDKPLINEVEPERVTIDGNTKSRWTQAWMTVDTVTNWSAFPWVALAAGIALIYVLR